MTIQEFDNTGWKAGTQVKVGNEKYHVWRIDFGLKRVQVPVNNEITTNMLWLHCSDFEVVNEPTAIDLIAAESYLERFEPELKKKLESHALRGQVCSVMKDYLELHTLLNNKERHEFLKTHLKNNES